MFRLNKNAYLQIDFFYVILFFILFFTIVYSGHISYLSQYEYVQEQKYLTTTAQDICVLLTQFEGIPSTWESDISSTSVVGLQNKEEEVLEDAKVQELFDQSNYADIVDILDISGVLYLSLKEYSTDFELFSTGEQASSGSQVGKARCFETYLGNLVVLDVEVWR